MSRVLIVTIILLTQISLSLGAQRTNHLREVKRIVTLGDSITQGGGAPGGYVWLLQQYLTALNPAQPIEIINAGISGHKATDMQARFQRDVIDKKPDLVTINVGINDVWHGFMDFKARVRHPKGDLPAGVPLAQYREKVTAMVKAAKAAGIKVVLLAPTIIYENLASEENLRLAQYRRAMSEIAKEQGVLFIDLSAPFRELITAYQKNAGSGVNLLTTDGVHMNPAGYQLMANTILRGLGVPEKELAAITIDRSKK